MPSITHETLLELIRNRPTLVSELLAGMLDVPAHEQVRLEPADCTVVAPAEYSADAVAVLREAGRPVLAVVVEIQLGRNPRKRRTWPVYVATVHNRWDCPTVLSVICVDAGVAAWCAEPVELGPGWRGVPLVLGPAEVPLLTSIEQAGGVPELAVLSALAHSRAPEYRNVLAALPEAAQSYLEAIMRTDLYAYQGKDGQELLARGEVKAKAADVLMVLEARGTDVPDDARGRITGCSDIDQLDTWLRGAVTVGSVAELFA